MSEEITLIAKPENSNAVKAFVFAQIADYECSPRTAMAIELSLDEIFVNIASYAYADEAGEVTVQVEVEGDPATLSVTFIDHGVPYNPLEKEDPDLSLSVEERQIGGLGIFLVKKKMDVVEYEFRDGQNILTIKKTLL